MQPRLGFLAWTCLLVGVAACGGEVISDQVESGATTSGFKWDEPSKVEKEETKTLKFSLGANEAASFTLSGAPLKEGAVKFKGSSARTEESAKLRDAPKVEKHVLWFQTKTAQEFKLALTNGGEKNLEVVARKVAIQAEADTEGEGICLAGVTCKRKVYCKQDHEVSRFTREGDCKVLEGPTFIEGAKLGTCEATCPEGYTLGR